MLLVNLSFAQNGTEPQYVMNGDVIDATVYHDNGTVAQTGSYTLTNKLHGKWMSYDENGNVTAIAYYDNGNKVGTWSFYKDEIMKEVTYVESKVSQVKTWKNTDIQLVSN